MTIMTRIKAIRVVSLAFGAVFLAGLLSMHVLWGPGTAFISGTADANASVRSTTGSLSFALSTVLSQSFPNQSDGFDFPVGSYGSFGLCPSDKGALNCYWICRGFQDTVNNVCQKTGYGDHLGEDWNRGSLDPTDFGDTIYAVSNGEVIFAQTDVPIANSTRNWGKVIIIRHTLPDGTQVESQYGHLKDMLVGVGASVTRGQPIATIGDGDGRWGSHLHFEIRYSNCPYWGAAGPAWSTIATGWANPSVFINAHRALDCGFTIGQGVTEDELTAFQNANASAGGLALLGCPVGPVDISGFTSFNGTVAHRQTFTAGQIQYLANGSNAGQAFAVLGALDAKWSSLGFDVNNPLGYATANRTSLLSTCYGTRRISQRFEGGSLEYHLTGVRAENVYEVHGAIYDKWSQKGFAACPLGMPTSDVLDAPVSGFGGNAGFVSSFEGGQIYWLANTAEAFEVHGAIHALYTQIGGAGSWLGFPISDVNNSGNPRVDFEGGYITTSDGINYQAFATGTPPAGADLSVTIEDSPDPVLVDENLTYTITVTNNGPNPATGVTLTDVLGSNFTFVSATPSQGTSTGTSTITCNFGDLANGASASLTLVVKVKTVGTAINTATVRGLEYDADALMAIPTGNNAYTEATVIDPKTDLSLTKSVLPNPGVIGQNVNYSMVAKNLGPSPATGVTVIDSLPADMEYVSASSTVGTCSEAGGTVTCNIGNLAKNATATITLVATAMIGGTISNTATVSGNEADIITSNNTVTRTSGVRTLSSLTFTPSTVAGCKDSVGKVVLNGTAPSGGVTVSLASDNPLVTVPPSVIVPASTTNVTFTATTSPVATSQPVTVTATLGPASKSATLTLRPIGVQSLSISPNPATGGSTATGTVTLECAAAPGDVLVAITSTNNSAAQVPSSLIVPAGALSQDFTITTGNVSTTSSSTIKASSAGTSASVVLQVQPGSGTNQAPIVNAGPDQTITLPAGASLSGTATDDGLPNPPATVTTTWTTVSGPGTVTFANASALNATASFSIVGTYVLRLTASDSMLSSSDDVTITVNSGGGGGGGSLSVSGTVPPATVDLTAEGSLDWAHWGLTSATSFNRKGGVTQQISNYTKIGSGTVKRFPDNLSGYSWTDGTPTATATNTTAGIFIQGVGKGFQITAPADTTDRTVKLHVGVWMAQGRLEVSLSDGSVPSFVDTSVNDNAGASVRVFTISYRAAAAGQQLRIKWTVLQSYSSVGNVTLQAATLAPGNGSASVMNKARRDVYSIVKPENRH
jgi:uncharacterized repeat protein (TIGR01451 family)